MDDMILFGEPVKALGGGKVGGYLVRFTDASKRDLTQQYFSAKSYLGPADGDGGECLFEHGITLKHDAIARGVTDKEALKLFDELAELTFTPLKTRRDKLGIWAQTVLDISNDYQKMVYEMAEDGRLGWSSGSAGHRIKIAQDGHIESWPIVEGSLTPRPCMPMDTCVMPMKQYFDNYADAIKAFFQPGENSKAVWTTAFVNDLPDSAFLYIESGGEKDEENKTKPRSLRHFPYKNADGEIDLPHLRNALARIPQSSLPDDVKRRVASKAQRIAKDNGVGDGKSIHGRQKISVTLKQYLDDLVDSGRDEGNILAEISRQTGLGVKAIVDILEGKEKPTAAKLKGFARVLEVDESLLIGSLNFSPKTIKGMFEDELAERVPSVWELWNAYCCVTQKLAMAAVSTQATGVEFDLEAKLEESTNEYMTRLKSQVMAQIQGYVDEGEMDEPFYLKAILNLTESDLLSAKHLDISQHSDLVVSALKEITARFRANHEARKSQKAGRVLSQKNRERLAQMLGQIQAAVSDCQSLLDESMPMASEGDMNKAKTALAYRKWHAKQIGVTL